MTRFKLFKLLLLALAVCTIGLVGAAASGSPLYASCDETGCTKYFWYQPNPEEESKTSEEVCNDNFSACSGEGCSLADSGFNTGTVWCRCTGSDEDCGCPNPKPGHTKADHVTAPESLFFK